LSASLLVGGKSSLLLKGLLYGKPENEEEEKIKII